MMNKNLEDYLIHAYIKKIEEDPESLLFMPLANAYKKRGMLDSAMETIERGLRCYPHYIGAKALSGELFFLSDELDRAESELKAVAENSPEHILSRRLLLEIYQKLNMPGEALKYANDLIRLCPTSHGQYLETKSRLLKEIEGIDLSESEVISGVVSDRDKESLKSLEKLYFGIQCQSTLRNKETRSPKEPVTINWTAFAEGKVLEDEPLVRAIPDSRSKDSQMEVFERMLSNIKRRPGGEL